MRKNISPPNCCFVNISNNFLLSVSMATETWPCRGLPWSHPSSRTRPSVHQCWNGILQYSLLHQHYNQWLPPWWKKVSREGRVERGERKWFLMGIKVHSPHLILTGRNKGITNQARGISSLFTALKSNI